MEQSDREALADAVRKRFTPFAFTCSCNGEHPDCKEIRNNDAYAIAQANVVHRISSYIRYEWKEELENV